MSPAAASAPATLVFRHCRQLISCGGPAPRRAGQQGSLEIVSDGTVVISGEHVVYAGSSAAMPDDLRVSPDGVVIDASDCSLIPGFVDPHTHAVFAGDRRDELRRRLSGESYAQIAAGGGGIVATVRATRAATEGELVRAALVRLDEMLACGTTTCEIKSGYGLEVDSELKLLRASRQLAAAQPVDIVSTFLGAHALPPESRDDRESYVDLVVNRMIPAVASEGLAEWCDVFCDTGYFTPEESRRILRAGLRAGLKPRIHADELGASGGSLVAADVGARSADHLVFADDVSIEALARASVTATLLPCAAFYLKLHRFAPARELIARGVPVALATDVNPGGGYSPSMPFAMTLGCFAMDLTFEEALAAATINAAWSLDRADSVGSLEPGKLADMVVIQGDAIDIIRIGAPAIQAVIKRGRVVKGVLMRTGRSVAR